MIIRIRPKNKNKTKQKFVLIKFYTSDNNLPEKIKEFNNKGQAYAYKKQLPVDRYCNFYYKICPKNKVTSI